MRNPQPLARLCLGSLCMFLALATRSAPLRTLNVVGELWPPLVLDERASNPGADMEVCQRVLSRLGYTVKFQVVPWQRALLMAKSGDVDAVIGIGRGLLNDRESYLAYPPEPLSASRLVLFYRKEDGFRYQGLPSLVGKTIGTTAGYSYPPDFSHAPYLTLEPAPTVSINLNKLKARRVDLIVADMAMGTHLAESMNLGNLLAFDPTPIARTKLYLAFSRSRGLDTLAEAFGVELRRFKQSPGYLEILRKYQLSATMLQPEH